MVAKCSRAIIVVVTSLAAPERFWLGEQMVVFILVSFTFRYRFLLRFQERDFFKIFTFEI